MTDQNNECDEPVCQKILDTLTDIVLYLDLDCRVKFANKAVERIFRLSHGEIIGRPCYDMLHNTTQPLDGCPFKAAQKSMRRERLEVATEGKVLEFTVDPMADAEGRFCGAVEIITDITDRKRLEAEKQLSLELLTEKKKEMEDFLYLVTHDLRSPLVNVQGFSQVISSGCAALRETAKSPELPQSVRDSIDAIAAKRIPDALTFINDSALVMQDSISSLLKYFRIGAVEMRPEKLAANEALQSVLHALRFQLDEAGATVKVADLPPCTADADALRHILTNLLANAVKYRGKSRPLVITVSGVKNGGAVIYNITDNGAGIKAADLPNIWRISYHNVTLGVAKRFSIGLPLVRRLAEKNSGRIWAESKEGQGSTFFIELPA